MLELKCPACGGEDFIPFLISGNIEIENNISTFVCTKCRRLEIYVKEGAFERVMGQHVGQKTAADKVAEINAIIAQRQDEYETLRAIVNDERQSVKDVRDAGNRMREIEAEIDKLKKNRDFASLGGNSFLVR